MQKTLPSLTKSRFLAGMQCPGRLYRQCYQRDLATPPDASRRALFAAGTRVGELARDLRPGGVLIDEPAFHHERAAARTRFMLERREPTPLYEAAFTAEGVRVRADLLSPLSGGGWELIEVKASTAMKPVHVLDLAIQVFVLEHAGLRVDHARLAHLDAAYTFDGDDHDVARLFTIVDLTDRVRDHLARIPGQLEQMVDLLRSEIVPAPDPGPFCYDPHECEFVDYCNDRVPDWSIDELPQLASETRERIRDAGARTIQQIPPTIELNEMQERVRQSVVSGEPFVGHGLAHALERVQAPAHFIDFETVGPALPRYAGTRPYEDIPFQWSDHVLNADGTLSHADFLAEGEDDPRRAFTESLLSQLEGAASVVVYSGFEAARLDELASTLPDLRERIESVRALPWIDLVEVVRDHYYHPEFHGSFAMKRVLPAVAVGFGYDDLRIQGGAGAAVAFQELASADTPEWRRTWLHRQLRAYGARDTVALFEITQALRRAAT